MSMGGIELTVVVPVLNERANIEPLFTRLQNCLQGIEWEVVFVDDDSKDGTIDAVREIAKRDRRARGIRRIGRRGLSGACLEGALSSSAPVVAVMDGDLQHDETRLPVMLEQIRGGNADLVVASRYQDNAGEASGFSGLRAFASQFATRLARTLLKVQIKDPMSGFFMLRREVINTVAPKLSKQGFKILLDIVASTDEPLRIAEVPYVFAARQHGQSKLDSLVMMEYVGLLVAKASGDLISARFLAFSVVGSFGVLIHLSTLHTLLALNVQFEVAQSAAMYTAMTVNYTLNNLFTYRDLRRRGWRFVTGLLMFAALCSIGVVGGVSVSKLLYTDPSNWWVAGLAAAVVGSVWNYISNSAITWRSK